MSDFICNGCNIKCSMHTSQKCVPYKCPMLECDNSNWHTLNVSNFLVNLKWAVESCIKVQEEDKCLTCPFKPKKGTCSLYTILYKSTEESR